MALDKANALVNLTNHKLHTDEIYLYTKYPYEAKYKLLINKRKDVGLENLNNSKAFILRWYEYLWEYQIHSR